MLEPDMYDSNGVLLDADALKKLKNRISANVSRQSLALFRNYLTELGNHLADLQGAIQPNLPAVWPQRHTFTAGTFSTYVINGASQWTVLVVWPQQTQAYTNLEVANFVWDCLGCEENQDATSFYDSDFDDLVLGIRSSCEENQDATSVYDSDFDDLVLDIRSSCEENQDATSVYDSDFDDLVFDISSSCEEKQDAASFYDSDFDDLVFDTSSSCEDSKGVASFYDPSGTCYSHSSSSGATTGSSASAFILVRTSKDSWSFCGDH
jgi:hypothetical protein